MVSAVSRNVLALSAVKRQGDRLAIEKAAVAAEGSARKGGAVTGNFKAAISARVERFQKLHASSAPDLSESGQALVESLAQAAAEVKDLMGPEAANAFMAKVLKGIEVKGFSLEGLADSVGAALRDIGQASAGYQVKKLTESFNSDLGLPAEGGREVKSLSRAMGDFFASAENDEAKPESTFGFDSGGRWVDLSDQPASDESKSYSLGSPESARLGLESGAAFTIKEIDSDTLSDLVNFLRYDLGEGEAADYLESQSENSSFMAGVDQAIALVLDGAKAEDKASKLENYLNSNVKGRINAMSTVNRNIYGEVEFEGWRIGRGPEGSAASGGASSEFSSSWRYTNRDDVKYVREGGDKSQGGGSIKEGYAGMNPGELYRRLDQAGQNGELFDEVL